MTRHILGALLATAILLAAPQERSPLPSAMPANAASEEELVYVIDVIVVHPNPPEDHLQTLIGWGRTWGETEMVPFLDATFDRVTQIYQDSGVPAIISVVHSEEIDLSYIDPDWKRVLSLALMNSELNNPTYAPYLEAIEALRDTYQADIVIYWRERNDGGPTSNGAGSIGGDEDEAYVHLTYGGMGPTITAHETGHLLGGQHSDGLQGEAVYSLEGDTPLLREYRTVMTIAVPLGHDVFKYIWRFSNPGHTVSGETLCSNLTGSPESCNFSETAPLGNAQHNAVETITAMVPVVASFRDGTPPLAIVCGDGFVEGNEACDDGEENGGPGSCCGADCSFKSDGPASCDDNVCTTDDVCLSGVCSAGNCQTGSSCSVCGGTCAQDGTSCECVL